MAAMYEHYLLSPTQLKNNMSPIKLSVKRLIVLPGRIEETGTPGLLGRMN